ncbi:MAG: IPTL-CTERM sorting domain-containing protein [Gammaproteobacteria bacterium]|nr:IPTL-CTERM sorting domain-containing protein [Gammaproteobacteria bacterium]
MLWKGHKKAGRRHHRTALCVLPRLECEGPCVRSREWGKLCRRDMPSHQLPRLYCLDNQGAKMRVSRAISIGAVAGITLLSSFGLRAQTISQPAGIAAFGAGTATGQSFTATLTGVVNRIDVRSRTTGGGTLYIYNGANGSGTVGVAGAPAYTQAIAMTDSGSDAAGFSSIVLTTPFPVTAGAQYSFAVSGFSVSGTNTNPYAGGDKLDDFAGPAGGQDISFQLFEALAAPTPASSAAIPTMSEWALIAMSSMLGMLGMAWVKRRRA